MRRVKLLFEAVARSVLNLVPSLNGRNRTRAFLYSRVRAYLPVQLLAEEGDWVVQVGAPRETTVEELAQSVGASGGITLVEAVEKNATRIRSFVAQPEFPTTAEVLSFAAYSRESTMMLDVSDSFVGDSALVIDGIEVDNHERQGAEFHQVEVRTSSLDRELSGRATTPDVLFIAINGAELGAVEGSQSILEGMRPGSRVFVKTHALLDDGETIFEPVQKILAESGFKTVRTMKSFSVSESEQWANRRGDIFAWKE